MAHDAVVPEISLDTPASLSPDEEVSQTRSEPQVTFEEPDASEENRPALRHATTAPASIDTPSSDTHAALETPRDDTSAGKG